MNVAARKTARRKARPANESTVYDGACMCGTITPRAGAFVARLTTGRSLGRFANERLAQRAITAAARAERTRQPQRGDAADGFARKPGEIVVGQGRGERPSKPAQTSASLVENSGSQT
jgi:hypothetical protein